MITKIWVEYGKGGYDWKSIDDPQQIQKVTKFIDVRRARDWFSAFGGAPSTKVRLFLYNGKEYKGFFGSGSGEFLCPDYRQKASAAETQEFMRLLGLESEENSTERDDLTVGGDRFLPPKN